jgi:retron-type reverse transcriptase
MLIRSGGLSGAVIKDRVVQAAVVLIMEPIFEARGEPLSSGEYRHSCGR